MTIRNLTGFLGIAGATFGLIFWLGGSVAADRSTTQSTQSAVKNSTVLSKVFHIDKKYRSMMGPYSEQEIWLGDPESDELLWITGYQAVMVEADGETPAAQEFMCHSNLDIDVDAHSEALKIENFSFSPRLFTLSQGQFDVVFPAGFGIPVRSSVPLDLTTQVLNLNVEGQDFEVRHRVTVSYVAESSGGMKPLFPTSAYGLALIEGADGYFGLEKPDAEDHGPGCLVGENASDHEYEDGLGRTFSGHWVVRPGREENHTLVTRLMRIPYDTSIHYIAVHLHPFAESLLLRDLTTKETVFESRAENFEERIGLARVDSLSSAEGIPVYRDHEYELVSIYNNTTDENQDSMAVMYIYLRDLELEKRLERLRRRGRWLG
jgi:hypothetical protein